LQVWIQPTTERVQVAQAVERQRVAAPQLVERLLVVETRALVETWALAVRSAGAAVLPEEAAAGRDPLVAMELWTRVKTVMTAVSPAFATRTAPFHRVAMAL
jgi:hypothetical protein